MKTNKKLHSAALTSTALILFLILASFTASAATEQSASSVGTYAYITNEFSSTVSVIDTATNTVTATAPAGSQPAGVAVNPAGTKVYVANFYLGSYESALSESIIAKPALIKGTEEHVETGEGTVSVIDTATNTLTATVPVESYPIGVAVNPTGTQIYVTNRGSDVVSVIDAATNTVTATVPAGSAPNGVAVNPAGTKIYVTNLGSNSVSVIDTATNTLKATVPVGISPFGIAVNLAGTKAYVSNAGEGTVSVIDIATNTVTSTVPVEGWPLGVAVNPAGTKVYVANYESSTVSVIDTTTNTVTSTVPVGISPFGVAVNPEGTQIYVANQGSDTVSVIDIATNTVTATVPVGSSPDAFGQFIVPLQAKPVTPVAKFSATPTSGKASLTVAFTDKSTGMPTKWKWSFGDGITSTTQNPKHRYLVEGTYTVSLKATNDAGSSTKTLRNYITVTPTNTRPGIYSKSK
jgi:YVTN family beta-propeller protein